MPKNYILLSFLSIWELWNYEAIVTSSFFRQLLKRRKPIFECVRCCAFESGHQQISKIEKFTFLGPRIWFFQSFTLNYYPLPIFLYTWKKFQIELHKCLMRQAGFEPRTLCLVTLQLRTFSIVAVHPWMWSVSNRILHKSIKSTSFQDANSKKNIYVIVSVNTHAIVMQSILILCNTICWPILAI